MSWQEFIFGRLSWSVLPQNGIAWFGALTLVAGVVLVLGAVSYFGKWKWLWDEWFTSLDPKKIGVMYIAVAFVMLVRGGVDALLIRTQQATSVGTSFGILSPTHFQDIFSSISSCRSRSDRAMSHFRFSTQ
jgi:cytochrome o ubiquinol oxidase subunit 1